jgi:predicted nucleotidyltransferase
MNQIILDEISQKLINLLDPKIIYLFGSYAWGNPDENSDIDLMIIISDYKESRIRTTANAYKEIRKFSNIPTDILIRTIDEFERFSEVEGSLNNKISTKGIKLYEKRANN